MISLIYGIFICVAGVVGVGWIIWMMRHGDEDRRQEDRARAFFDANGHWPDETLEDAEAERRRLAAAPASAPVSRAGSDGVV
ncbi:hypothetical protein FSW04_23490 [Baekduia soli]|uniref:Uncharacterized protein n=1 Tax=Baekduia soli TaxID=496014 RepID=A0A5B8UAN3_9ACTN|nr:hypothetical protein [Baekduia soli]QEC50253.1 hypothetical protein FSW04_23490 [Baekduia soli]